MDTLTISLFFVGDTMDEAREGMPFDSEEAAQEYADETGGRVYMADARIDFSTMCRV